MRTPPEKPVAVQHGYRFCPEIIFDAFINAEMVAKWLFIGPDSKLIKINIDAQAGGKFSLLERDNNNGEEIDHFGEYKVVDRPHQLVFTLSVPKHFPGETEVSIHISTQPGGCLLHLAQTGVPPKTTEKNWREMLDKMDEVLKEMAKKTL